MLIECDRCRSIYEVEPGLLKPEGSKVRCTVCGNVFTARPEAPEGTAEFSFEEPKGHTVEPASRQDNSIDEKTDLDDILRELNIGPTGRPEAKENKDGAPAAKKDPTAIKDSDTSPRQVSKDKIKPYKFEPPPSKPSGRRTMLMLIVLFLVGACGSVVWFAPELIPWNIPFLTGVDTPQQDAGMKLLSFSELKSSFVDSKNAGKLFVIRGLVKNNDKSPRGIIAIKVSLLDARGQNIRSLQVFAGNSYEDPELYDMDMNSIRAAMSNRVGKNNSNLKIPPGGSIPFMAVFDNLPENVSEFAVEAVGSVALRN